VFVEIGEIVNAVGLRGEVKVLVTGNFEERILTSGFLRMRAASVRDDGRSVRCLRHRWKGSVVIAQLDGIGDRNAAEAAMGSTLGFRAADFDEPGFPRGDRLPAFVYLDLRVETTRGTVVGRVEDVMTLPANWVLRVLAHEGTREEMEILVPVIDDVIREVDRARGRLVIEALPGLLDEFETT
jgi:16S rRNA processing protein RimM